jgi:hypothetical protein
MSRGAEYMFDEEERERSFSENLGFYTGASYITGAGKKNHCHEMMSAFQTHQVHPECDVDCQS